MTQDMHQFITVLVLAVAALALSWNARRVALSRQAKAIQQIQFDLEWLCTKVCKEDRETELKRLKRQEKWDKVVSLPEYRRGDDPDTIA
jgi:hypothetical protein